MFDNIAEPGRAVMPLLETCTVDVHKKMPKHGCPSLSFTTEPLIRVALIEPTLLCAGV